MLVYNRHLLNMYMW